MSDTVKQLASLQIPSTANTFDISQSVVDWARYASCVDLDSTHFIVIWTDTYTTGIPIYAKLATITDGVVSYGDAFLISSTSSSGYCIKLIKLDTTRAVLMFCAASTHYGTAVVIKNTDGALSKGSSYVFSSAASNNSILTGCKVDTDKIVVGYNVATVSMKVLTISDVTITGEGAESTVSSRYVNHIEQMKTDAFHLVYGVQAYNTPGAIYNMYCVVSGTNIVQGTPNATIFTGHYGCISKRISDTTVLITDCVYTPNSYVAVVNTIDHGALTISNGTGKNTGVIPNAAGSSSVLINFDNTNFGLVTTKASSIVQLTPMSVSGTTITIYTPRYVNNAALTYFGSSATWAHISDSLVYIISGDNYRFLNCKPVSISNNTLNVLNSGTVCITAPADGVIEISSIKLTNTGNATTKVILYTNDGVGDEDIDSIQSITANSTTTILMPNSPIILDAGKSLIASQDVNQPITFKAYGVEVTE